MNSKYCSGVLKGVVGFIKRSGKSRTFVSRSRTAFKTWNFLHHSITPVLETKLNCVGTKPLKAMSNHVNGLY